MKGNVTSIDGSVFPYNLKFSMPNTVKLSDPDADP